MSRARFTAAVAAAAIALVGALAVPAAGSPASPGPPVLPDVIEEVPTHLQIQNTQQGEWLRFTTAHINVGEGNLQIRGGDQIGALRHRRHALRAVHASPPRSSSMRLARSWRPSRRVRRSSTRSTTTGTSRRVAEFAIRSDARRPDLATGVRSRSASSTWSSPARRVREEGSSRARTSSATATCRDWPPAGPTVPPVDAAPGAGHHRASRRRLLPHPPADPDNHWLESDEANNFTWVQFRLSRKGANPRSPCSATHRASPR